MKTDGKPLFISASELQKRKVPARTRWGPWRRSGQYLVTEAGGYEYAISLSTCTSSAQVLDWIAQIAMKTWASDAVVAELVRALDDLLHLQGRLCGSGQDKRLTKTEIRTMLRRTP